MRKMFISKNAQSFSGHGFLSSDALVLCFCMFGVFDGKSAAAKEMLMLVSLNHLPCHFLAAA